VATGGVVQRADDRGAMHPSSRLGEQFTDADTGDVCIDRLELAADLAWRVRLQVPHVLGGGTAKQI
jgi:hypothetical protein